MTSSKKPYIIFDFGNVLLDIDYRLTFRELCKICDRDWKTTGIPKHVLQWMNDLESGNMRPETFLWNFQFHFNAAINPRDLIDAWNALLIKIPESRFDFLMNLRKEYKVALLSNTNQIHLDWVYRHLKNDHNIDPQSFENDCFDEVFYSHKVNCRKPEAEIYNHVISKLGISEKQTLFVDDLKDNVDAALSCGWFAVHHDPNNDIEKILPDYIKQWSDYQH